MSIETIELDFDVSLNTMMIRYEQLQRAYARLVERQHFMDEKVCMFLIDNLSKEITHMVSILNKEIPNEIKAQEATSTG